MFGVWRKYGYPVEVKSQLGKAILQSVIRPCGHAGPYSVSVAIMAASASLPLEAMEAPEVTLEAVTLEAMRIPAVQIPWATSISQISHLIPTQATGLQYGTIVDPKQIQENDEHSEHSEIPYIAKLDPKQVASMLVHNEEFFEACIAKLDPNKTFDKEELWQRAGSPL